ncbi:uncharacterized protein [Amphiura filiformis]|uniref:uncharacterized protein n=1 Tax=Amphiura filiformis TaxID=82378 RepID=UPI003B228027
MDPVSRVRNETGSSVVNNNYQSEEYQHERESRTISGDDPRSLPDFHIFAVAPTSSKMNRNIVNLANFDMVDPDAEFICPYDPVHKIIAKRFPYHVMRCRKNWNGRSMLTCVFNARHIVPASEHRHHIDNCPDRKCIEADFAYQQRLAGVHQSGFNTKGCTSLPNYDRDVEPDAEEDWDNEISEEAAVGYNPDDYQGPPVFQNLTGYTAGEKRQFHNDIGTVHFKTQQDVDKHPSRPFPTDSDQSGHVQQPHMTNLNPNGASNYMHQPHARAATYQHIEQPQNTASVVGEQQAGLRLPRQPAKAAAMATGTSNSQQGAKPKSKKGGRLQPTYSATGEASNGNALGPTSATTASTTAWSQVVSTPANSQVDSSNIPQRV